MRYSVRADASKKAVELDIFDDIGQGGLFFEAVSAKSVRRFLTANASASEIKLRVNSKGGDVLEGFAIYNMLAQHPAKVVAEVDGLAASMASVVVMAADEIHMASNARIMIHNPSGTMRGSSSDMRRVADLLDSMRDDIADAYVARTGIARTKVLEMMDAETWLTAADAKKHKFADVITPAKTRPSAQITACLATNDLDDFNNVPDDVRAEVLASQERNFARVGKDATVSEDVAELLIEVEEVNEEKPGTPAAPDFAALISAAVSDAVAPLAQQVTALQAQVTATASATESTASAATFAASVAQECERVISAGKLPNSPEARAFFAGQAKDATALKAMTEFYAQAPALVATEPFKQPAVGESGPKLSAEQTKLCNAMNWDPKVLFAKE